jgi:hypothetical protein
MAEEKKVEKAEAPKKYRVTIHSGQDEADKGDVFLAHNFRGIQIQRDKEVVIDEHYLNALKQSMIHTTIKEDGVVRNVTVPRFSFNVEPV